MVLVTLLVSATASAAASGNRSEIESGMGSVIVLVAQLALAPA